MNRPVLAATLSIALLSPVIALAQHPRAAGSLPRYSALGASPHAPWERARVDRRDASPLDVYTARVAGRRPLVVMLQGSNCLPLFAERQRADGRINFVSSMPFEFIASDATRAVHLAIVERVGVRSFGPTIQPSDWPPRSRYTPACEERAYDKQLRVRDVADTVLALQNQDWVERIFIVGHSEGADIATGVAALLGPEHVAGVALVSGAGPTQFFDTIELARHQHDDAGTLAAFQDLLWFTQSPPSAESIHVGVENYSVRRWTTFAIDSTPLEDIRNVHIPVFVSQGSADRNVAVESADLFVAELLRGRRQPVRYLLLPSLDHGQSCPDGTDHWREVFDEAMQWLLSAHPASAVTQRSFCPATSPN